MTTPDGLRYTERHEWVRADGATLTVGITDFATSALGDIVYVALPAVGDALTAGAPCGEIESTKSVSDLNAPVSGTVTEINPVLDAAPETVGQDPYGAGWLFRFTADDDGSCALLDATAYRALVTEG